MKVIKRIVVVIFIGLIIYLTYDKKIGEESINWVFGVGIILLTLIALVVIILLFSKKISKSKKDDKEEKSLDSASTKNSIRWLRGNILKASAPYIIATGLYILILYVLMSRVFPETWAVVSPNIKFWQDILLLLVLYYSISSRKNILTKRNEATHRKLGTIGWTLLSAILLGVVLWFFSSPLFLEGVNESIDSMKGGVIDDWKPFLYILLGLALIFLFWKWPMLLWIPGLFALVIIAYWADYDWKYRASPMEFYEQRWGNVWAFEEEGLETDGKGRYSYRDLDREIEIPFDIDMRLCGPERVSGTAPYQLAVLNPKTKQWTDWKTLRKSTDVVTFKEVTSRPAGWRVRPLAGYNGNDKLWLRMKVHTTQASCPKPLR